MQSYLMILAMTDPTRSIGTELTGSPRASRAAVVVQWHTGRKAPPLNICLQLKNLCLATPVD